jgi:flagellar biosynthetic protein FlhB
MSGQKSAGDRTEKPTSKRIKDAREKGQVARSRDLSAALSIIAVTLVLGWLGSRVMAGMAGRVLSAFEDMGTMARGDLGLASLSTLIWSDLGLFALTVGPLAVAGAVLSVATSVAQTGWVVSPKAMEFNWGRLSPSSGVQKFSPIQAGGELIKALVGLSAVGALCYVVVRPVFDIAPTLSGMPPIESAKYAWQSVSGLLFKASLLLAALAIGDYGLQWWRWYKQLKMTRQEVRDDHKSQDGSPQMKGRIRRIQREMSRKRMLQAVRTATVVVTNPTHVAVALRYERDGMTAPLIVAMGQDEMAARIRKVAREHDIPVVENVSLARALFASSEVGDVIPGDLFGAVAEVLAYLVRMKQLVL